MLTSSLNSLKHFCLALVRSVRYATVRFGLVRSVFAFLLYLILREFEFLSRLCTFYFFYALWLNLPQLLLVVVFCWILCSLFCALASCCSPLPTLLYLLWLIKFYGLSFLLFLLLLCFHWNFFLVSFLYEFKLLSSFVFWPYAKNKKNTETVKWKLWYWPSFEIFSSLRLCLFRNCCCNLSSFF